MDILGLNIGRELFSDYNLFLIGIALFWTLIASIEDIRKREVENWWTFSLIIFVLAFRAFLSIESWNYWYFAWGLIGLLGGFILANLFYYGRLFAGGDAKLLMALGTILPLSLNWMVNLQLLIVFLLAFLLAGSVYGMLYSLGMMLVHFSNFKKEFSKQFRVYCGLIIIVDSISLILMLLSIYFNFYIGVALFSIIFIAPGLLLYAKTIEEACMIKLVDKNQLTIGDWLYQPLKIGTKKIMPDWEGLSEKQLGLIQNKFKGKVYVKQGLPFVPAFLIAFILLLGIIYFGYLI